MNKQRKRQQCIEVCRICADECIANAKRCTDAGLLECARLCTECADVCNKAINQADDDMSIFDACADACSACAAECEMHKNPHCEQCAQICRKCEEECLSMTTTDHLNS